MTKEEFDEIIEEQHKKGLDDEDIAKVFALMFKDGKINREQIEGILEAMGYQISPEYKGMDDEEFKEKILVEGNEDEQSGDKPAPEANKQELEEKREEKADEKKPEAEVEETEEEEEDDGEERKKAMKMFRLED